MLLRPTCYPSQNVLVSSHLPHSIMVWFCLCLWVCAKSFPLVQLLGTLWIVGPPGSSCPCILHKYTEWLSHALLRDLPADHISGIPLLNSLHQVFSHCTSNLSVALVFPFQHRLLWCPLTLSCIKLASFIHLSTLRYSKLSRLPYCWVVFHCMGEPVCYLVICIFAILLKITFVGLPQV